MDPNEKEILEELLNIYYSKTRIFQGDVTLVPYIKNWLWRRNLEPNYILELMLRDENRSAYASLLGFFYLYGIGVSANEHLALEWYQIGADQGIFISEYQTAFLLHSENNGLERAFGLFQESANNGSDIAQIALGWCYQYGNGCPRDTTRALEQFREVALRGNCGGMYYYAIALSTGLGGQVNEQTAEYWYKKAADAGHWNAQHAIARIYHRRHDLFRSYYWYLKSAESSCVHVLLDLAKFESHEKRDKHAAIRWCRRARRNGYMGDLSFIFHN
ncbi:13927_t:CDS:1 [Ambispora leptoticha]|uniref:13927_t:CDS:1 n=1 Tax=Ambispora leptoticha TaxID=144679 RepID=A0A9N9BGJ0_9GLOM|nr:13927_t:CDS:1 [Ambispora leptoticha]